MSVMPPQGPQQEPPNIGPTINIEQQANVQFGEVTHRGGKAILEGSFSYNGTSYRVTATLDERSFPPERLGPIMEQLKTQLQGAAARQLAALSGHAVTRPLNGDRFTLLGHENIPTNLQEPVRYINDLFSRIFPPAHEQTRNLAQQPAHHDDHPLMEEEEEDQPQFAWPDEEPPHERPQPLRVQRPEPQRTETDDLQRDFSLSMEDDNILDLLLDELSRGHPEAPAQERTRQTPPRPIEPQQQREPPTPSARPTTPPPVPSRDEEDEGFWPQEHPQPQAMEPPRPPPRPATPRPSERAAVPEPPPRPATPRPSERAAGPPPHLPEDLSEWFNSSTEFDSEAETTVPEPPPRPAAPPPREQPASLLDEIRQGKRLRKADEQDNRPPSPAETTREKTQAEILAEAIDKRRGAMHTPEDDDAVSEEDSEWR